MVDRVYRSAITPSSYARHPFGVHIRYRRAKGLRDIEAAGDLGGRRGDEKVDAGEHEHRDGAGDRLATSTVACRAAGLPQERAQVARKTRRGIRPGKAGSVRPRMFLARLPHLHKESPAEDEPRILADQVRAKPGARRPQPGETRGPRLPSLDLMGVRTEPEAVGVRRGTSTGCAYRGKPGNISRLMPRTSTFHSLPTLTRGSWKFSS